MNSRRRADKSSPERLIGPSAAASGDRGGGAGVAAELAGGATGGDCLRLFAAQPGALSLAVVLGLLLRGDRLAAVRAGAGPGRAGEPARGAARRRLHRPHDLLEPAGLAGPLALLQHHFAQLLPDRDDPAAAAGLGLEDRRRRSDAGAADRSSHGLAGRQPRPRGRWAALDPAAGRVRARRLAEVRTGLGPALERTSRLPAAGPAQPQAGLRRPAGPRRRPPTALRDAGQHDVVALTAGDGTTIGDAGAGRAAVGRAPRASSSTRRSRVERDPTSLLGPPSPRSPCRTCRRRSAIA